MQQGWIRFALVAVSLGLGGAVAPAHAQDAIIFTPGTGATPALPNANPPAITYVPATPRLSCADLHDLSQKLTAKYRHQSVKLAHPIVSDGVPPEQIEPKTRLNPTLLSDALASYSRHICYSAAATGPAEIIVVDFAKSSSEPRLYTIDLRNGAGLDSPIPVAHGVGSDPDDDGIAQAFSNEYNSLMSSLGAARGSEIYNGRNGRSLRLDGLDSTNSAMRVRDIVVHSYQPQKRRYFNYSLLSARQGKPGTSEGCFVVEPERRDWLFSKLQNGGFLYAGLGGKYATVDPPRASYTVGPLAGGQIIFTPGTGATTVSQQR